MISKVAEKIKDFFEYHTYKEVQNREIERLLSEYSQKQNKGEKNEKREQKNR